MSNLKLGGVILLVGAVMFLLSDTIFGESEAASYAAFFGLILFPLGIILTVVGLFQMLFKKIRERRGRT
jgi:predicted phage tail protein